MKKIARKTLGLAGFLLITSCGNTEDRTERISSVQPKSTDARVDEEKTSTVTYEAEPVEKTTKENQVTNDLAEVAASDAPSLVTDLSAPLAPMGPGGLPQNGFMAGVRDVHPMQANYVGSYGVLPSRIAKDGPFLYSLPVDPDGRRRRHHSDFSDD